MASLDSPELNPETAAASVESEAGDVDGEVDEGDAADAESMRASTAYAGRSSVVGELLKYKHLYGTVNKKAETYYNLSPAVC